MVVARRFSAQHIRRIKNALRSFESHRLDRALLERNLTARRDAGEVLTNALVTLIEQHMSALWWQQPELWIDDDDVDEQAYRPCEITAINHVYRDARRAVFPASDTPDEVSDMERWIADQLYRDDLPFAEGIVDYLEAMYPNRSFAPDSPEVALELLHSRYGHLVEEYHAHLKEAHYDRSRVRRENREARAGVRQVEMAFAM